VTPSETPSSTSRAALAATSSIQHQLNNPLAALLAEAQLLRTEPGLSRDHAMAVDRMIDITRRIIALVRDLDGKDPGPR